MNIRQIKTGVKLKNLYTKEIWEVLARNYNEVLLIFSGTDGKTHMTYDYKDVKRDFEIVN